MKKALVVSLFVAVMVIGIALPSFAFTTAPVQGSMLYEAYDLVVNQFLHGAMGFIIAVLLAGLGIGAFIMQKIIPGVICFVCAGIIYRIDTIVQSLGAMF